MQVASLPDFLGDGAVSLPRMRRDWRLVGVSCVVVAASGGSRVPVIDFYDGVGGVFIQSAPHVFVDATVSTAVSWFIGATQTEGYTFSWSGHVDNFTLTQDPGTGAGTLIAASATADTSAMTCGPAQVQAPLPDLWLSPEIRVGLRLRDGGNADTVTGIRFVFDGGGTLDEIFGEQT